MELIEEFNENNPMENIIALTNFKNVTLCVDCLYYYYNCYDYEDLLFWTSLELMNIYETGTEIACKFNHLD